MREIELKLLLDDEQVQRLRVSPALRAMSEQAAKTQTLTSTYFDTPDQALRTAGIALRLRRKGRQWLQTVKKASAPIAGGLAQPLEDEIAVKGRNLALNLIADDDLREEVMGLARGGLAPVAGTRFRRTTHLLRAPTGGLVELAIDVGEITADDASAPFTEAEFELVDGQPGDLFAVAAEAITQGPVRYSNHSKSARARMLAEEGHAVEPLAPLRAAPVALAPGDTAEQAAALVLTECLGHALAAIPVTVLTDDPEGPHQLRVGLRRLRSAMSAFRGVLGRAALAPLADAARRIGAEAGRLRDLDVLAGELLAPMVARHPNEPGFAALTNSILARRDIVRSDACGYLSGPEVTRFGFEAAGFLAGRGWLDPADHGQTERLAEPVERLAVRQLDKRWKALGRYGLRIGDLTIEERHDMRKEIKKLRYVGEVFRSLFDEGRVAEFRSGIKRLQTAFGALNDAAMAEEMLLAADAPGRDDPYAQRAAGWLLGASGARAEALWPRAVADWKALKASGPFWR